MLKQAICSVFSAKNLFDVFSSSSVTAVSAFHLLDTMNMHLPFALVIGKLRTKPTSAYTPPGHASVSLLLYHSASFLFPSKLVFLYFIPGERYGYPLHFSCLKNPTDREAWQVTFHRVAKSQTGLSK